MTPAEARHRHPDGARAPRKTPTRARLALGAVAVLVPIAAVIAAAVAAAPVSPPNSARLLPTIEPSEPTMHATGIRPGARATASPSASPAPVTTWDPAVIDSRRPSTPTEACRCAPRSPVPSPTSPAPSSTVAPAAEPPPPDPVDEQPAAAAVLLELVNRDRLANGCGPVAAHPSLVDQSQEHADAQAADDAMNHSDGVTGFDTWGENVAAGFDTAQQVHDAWMASTGHRGNVLNCSFIYLGFGAADSATGVRYWTEQFAA